MKMDQADEGAGAAVEKVTLAPVQIEMARHALGFDGRRKMSYRNHYCINDRSPDYSAWLDMVERKLAVCRKTPKKGPLQWAGDFFYLTMAGALAVLRKGESLDLEYFPYDKMTAPTPAQPEQKLETNPVSTEGNS